MPGYFLIRGEGGIRTLDTLSGIPVFETSALSQLCDLSSYKLVELV